MNVIFFITASAAGRSPGLCWKRDPEDSVLSHEKPEPLEPHRVYPFEVEIWAIANLFRAGHRLRVTISTSDFPFFASNPIPSRNRIFHDSRYPSRLIVPVVER